MAAKTLPKTALLLVTFQLLFLTCLVTSSDSLLKTSDCGCDDPAPSPPPPGCDDTPPKPSKPKKEHTHTGHDNKPHDTNKSHPDPPPAPACENALKLGVCARVLNGLLNAVLGLPPTAPDCCSLLKGVLDLEGALCLCTAVRMNVLGINLNIPIDLTLLLNYCGCGVPEGFSCS